MIDTWSTLTNSFQRIYRKGGRWKWKDSEVRRSTENKNSKKESWGRETSETVPRILLRARPEKQ